MPQVTYSPDEIQEMFVNLDEMLANAEQELDAARRYPDCHPFKLRNARKQVEQMTKIINRNREHYKEYLPLEV